MKKIATLEKIIEKNFGIIARQNFDITMNPVNFSGYINLDEYINIHKEKLAANNININYLYVVYNNMNEFIYINEDGLILIDIDKEEKFKDIRNIKIIQYNLNQFFKFVKLHIKNTTQAINNCIF